MVKFIAAFAILGAIVSVSFGVIAGNGLTHVVLVAFFCTAISAALGGGVYRVLKQRVPELFEFFEQGASSEAELDSIGESVSDGDGTMLQSEGEEALSAVGNTGSEGADKGQFFGDHILVNKVKIKNEPKLIAQAVRTMLAKDN